MLGRGALFALAFSFLILSVDLAGAVHSVSVTAVSSTLSTVSISGASDVYAYEVNFTNPTSVTATAFYPLLADGGTTTSGTSTRGDYFYVYESRLDNTQAGVLASGNIFNVSYTGTLTLKGSTVISSDGTEEYVSYNADGTTSSSGTSGGGSSATLPTTPSSDVDVTITPEELSVNITSNKISSEEITLKNNGASSVTLKIDLEGFEDAVIGVPRSVRLEPDEEKKIDVKFVTSGGGLVVGKILFNYGDSLYKEIPVVLNSRSENFLFDTSLFLARQFKRVGAGTTLRAQISLKEVGVQAEKVDVVASYIIKDFSGNSYLEESETFFVLGDKEFVKEFSTENLPPGKYILGLELVYPGAFATTSSQFEIVSNSWFTGTNGIILLIVVMVAIVAGVVIWSFARKRKVRRIVKKRR